jgi:hypothetical protein
MAASRICSDKLYENVFMRISTVISRVGNLPQTDSKEGGTECRRVVKDISQSLPDRWAIEVPRLRSWLDLSRSMT